MSVVALDRVTLSSLLEEHRNDDPPSEPVMPFSAYRYGQSGAELPIIVTALLERTAAYHAFGDRYDTGVLRLDLVFVDPRHLEWRTATTSRDTDNGQLQKRWNGARQVNKRISREASLALAGAGVAVRAESATAVARPGPKPTKTPARADKAPAPAAVIPPERLVKPDLATGGIVSKPSSIELLIGELEQNRIRRGEILAELHLAIEELGRMHV